MFLPLNTIEPRMKGPHAISLFKLIKTDGEDIHPAALMIVWQNSLHVLNLERQGKLEEYINQMEKEDEARQELLKRLSRGE